MSAYTDKLTPTEKTLHEKVKGLVATVRLFLKGEAPRVCPKCDSSLGVFDNGVLECIQCGLGWDPHSEKWEWQSEP